MVSGQLNELTRPSWGTRAALALLAVLVALSGFASGTSAPAARAQEAQQQSGAGADADADAETDTAGTDVIVMLEEGADPVEAAHELGVEPTHIYSDVFTGFAGNLPPEALAEARASDAVQRITPDGEVHAEGQTIPTGVTRVGVPVLPGTQHLNIASPINADIAILDTGVSRNSDLNVAGGVSCIDHQAQQENAKNKKKKKKHKKGKGKDKGGHHKGKKHNKNKKNSGSAQSVSADTKTTAGGAEGVSAAKNKHKNNKHKKDKGKGKNKGGHHKGKNTKGKGDHGKNGGNKKKNQKRRQKEERREERHGPNWEDDNGHGTHTAGIAAALDNDDGVVGVAPGARVWSVKVLDANGSGTYSDVICGLDWVAANAGTIDVVNLSLSGEGGEDSNPPFHTAVSNVVNAGVVVVVAAGNQGTDAASRVPASFDEVLTVSGLSDSNGQPGGGGERTCFGLNDDAFLIFSNFGHDVDIMAPGDCILSLQPQGGPIRESGTSEASPHVAGAVAHFIAGRTNATGIRPTVLETRDWLMNVASRSQVDDGVLGDPDGIPEPVLWLAALASG
jgi:subtilisin family serine protease